MTTVETYRHLCGLFTLAQRHGFRPATVLLPPGSVFALTSEMQVDVEKSRPLSHLHIIEDERAIFPSLLDEECKDVLGNPIPWVKELL